MKEFKRMIKITKRLNKDLSRVEKDKKELSKKYNKIVVDNDTFEERL